MERGCTRASSGVWQITRLCNELRVAHERRRQDVPGGAHEVQRALEALRAEEEGRYRRLEMREAVPDSIERPADSGWIRTVVRLVKTAAVL